jgi:beta-lactam-binding protein with PASTA domain
MKIIPSDITYEKRCKTDIKNGKEVNLFVSTGGIILYAENLENQTEKHTRTEK